MRKWPEGGPKRLWTASRIGHGYSSPIIAEGALYITGDVDDALVISAFDLDGPLRWKTTNGRSWKGPWPGARASCSYDEGRLYHMNAHGRVVCLDPADGKEIWAVDALERFGAGNISWGVSECLLVDGDRVIVTPGGAKSLMAALDKKTGETVWSSEPLRFQRTRRSGGEAVDPPLPDADKAGYAYPILCELGGHRLIAGCSARHLFCVDAETGKILWTHQIPTRYEVIGSIPLLWRDSIFFTAPDDFGGQMFRVRADGDRVRFEKLWETPLDNCHGALVLVDGRLYGSGYRRFRGWACIDASTGEMLYSDRNLANGSVIHADGRLYVLAEDGVMALLKPTPNGFETAGRFRLVDGPQRQDAWAHPVICRGRLYLRRHDDLFCYDIRER
ncbi:MAG TPA: PQQ-binding-like beta-propeller repeat protein [Sumerlaeia bacterium]|nr:PQQ-binding-like beta-propeller repeat protein [Sumerlaeia bacterium]